MSALNVRLGCIDGKKVTKEAEELIKAADDSNKSILGTDNGLQLWKFFNTPMYKRLTRGQDKIYL